MVTIQAIKTFFENDKFNFQTIMRKSSIRNLYLQTKKKRTEKGKLIENMVIQYFQDMGLNVYQSNEFDDKYNKIDMFLVLNKMILKCQIKTRFKNNDPIVESMRNITFKSLNKLNTSSLLNGRDIIKDIDLYIICNSSSLIILESDIIKKISIRYSIELLNLYKYFIKYKRFYKIQNKRIIYKNNKRVVLIIEGSEGSCVLLRDKNMFKINFFANIGSCEYIKLVKDVKLFNLV